MGREKKFNPSIRQEKEERKEKEFEDLLKDILPQIGDVNYRLCLIIGKLEESRRKQRRCSFLNLILLGISVGLVTVGFVL